jgi:hypothetical protein
MLIFDGTLLSEEFEFLDREVVVILSDSGANSYL